MVVDGLGFEEVGQAVTSTNIISGTNVFAAGSATAGRVLGTVMFSGADVFAAGSLTAGRVLGTIMVSGATIHASASYSGVNLNLTGSALANGYRLRSVNIGSPATYSCFTQAGSVATSAGSQGTVLFGIPFSTANYFVNLTPVGSTSGFNAPYYTSGTQRVSGVEMVGGASQTYHWVAVGV